MEDHSKKKDKEKRRSREPSSDKLSEIEEIKRDAFLDQLLLDPEDDVKIYDFLEPKEKEKPEKRKKKKDKDHSFDYFPSLPPLRK